MQIKKTLAWLLFIATLCSLLSFNALAQDSRLAQNNHEAINFEESVKVGNVVKKGDMLGYFLFGGSDFVIVFQRDVDFKLTVPKEGDGAYHKVLMGEEYGRITL